MNAKQIAKKLDAIGDEIEARLNGLTPIAFYDGHPVMSEEAAFLSDALAGVIDALDGMYKLVNMEAEQAKEGNHASKR